MLSRELEETLRRAMSNAALQSHEFATLEHLLMALTEDSDAMEVLHACDVDIKELVKKLIEFIEVDLASIVNANGDDGYAPLAIERGIPALAKAASEFGIAVMTLTHTHHFAALWPEVEALAEQNLAGMACVSYMPNVAPHGSNKPLFGTNPLAFAWPRKNKPPFVFDMATSAMAGGDIAIAARDGHSVPLGTGLDENGNETTDPAAILKGVMLPFGGHKGSAIATMVELLAAGATGERFSFEAQDADNGDGGPPRGGEFFLAFSPSLLAGEGWEDHCEKFFDKYEAIPGSRLPGARRHNNRNDTTNRAVDAKLIATIQELCSRPDS